MIFPVLSVIALAVAMSTTGYAQQSGAGKTLTLQECIAIGLAKNADLLRASNEVDRSASMKKQSFGRFLPSVSADASWSRNDKDIIRFRTDKLVVSRNVYNYGLGSNLVLFDGFANILGADQSILSLKASERGYERRKEDLIFNVQQAFMNALRMQQLVLVNESNLDRSRKQLDRIRELHAVGSVPQADVYRQQVQVGRDELTLMQSKNDFDNSLVDLQAQIGLIPVQDFSIDPGDIPLSVDSADVVRYHSDLPDINTLIAASVRQRADYKQAQLLLEASGKAVGIASAGHLPQISAFAQYGWSNIELKDFTKSSYTQFVYGLSLSIPIFSGFSVSSAVERAQIDRLNSETTVSELERGIIAGINKALNTLSLAEKNIDITRRTLRSAQEDHRIASERYNLGAGTLLDLIVANSGLTAAQSDVVNATFNYYIARKQVEYQLGKLS